MDEKQAKMLEEVHEAVVGSTSSVGLQEQVRTLDSRLTRVEGLVARATNGILDRAWGLLAAAATGWFASHFPGTRP